ncbi:transcriptional regulator [Burkholderia pyrrocinia]|uniref:MerR family transcriptional regulator n=1 Tax=Burkholderia stagnalis TaxID=1503054 RepID=UPI00075855B3|nr:MerR family transcriptional regulator [Burkholderia stagnalis]KVN28570.1 transcriptional regulator [Burkholderia pyrrocinia]WGS45059.1 MerR family transcriptional regulator [Burkholderia sp. JSH-S8]
MKIGELAARTGMTTSAIRFYEQSGLLPPAGRGQNGYRIYDEASAERLRMIQLAQRLGFSLVDMRVMADEMDAFSKAGLLVRLDERMREIDAMRAQLDAQRAELRAIRATLEAEWEEGRCVSVDRLDPPADAQAAKPGRRAGRAAPALEQARRRKSAG